MVYPNIAILCFYSGEGVLLHVVIVLYFSTFGNLFFEISERKVPYRFASVGDVFGVTVLRISGLPNRRHRLGFARILHMVVVSMLMVGLDRYYPFELGLGFPLIRF